ncbi:MAG: alcohol dehydrogenase catalytic domain-containing protein [Peptostreptococcaceae bacterium]|nr:alcohol dehydrogenase catalytic domain-containing protein [Peptostreptococcaceae bacterium]
MKAIKIEKPFDISLIDVAKPESPKNYEILIKVMATGICGSDVAIYKGLNPVAKYPRIIGHEVTGIVESIGDKVTKHNIGNHVIVKQTESCGHCWACLHGQDNVCTELKVRGVTIDGGYQEYYKVSENSAYTIDKCVDLKTAVLIEPYTIGFQACSRGQLTKDDFLLVNGAGALGAIVIDVAKSFGCKILAIDISKEKLEQAKYLGADYTLDGNDKNICENILKITEGYGSTISIDCVCNPKSVEFLVGVTGNGGRVVTMGFDTRNSSISQFLITSKQLSIIGSRLQHEQFEKVIKLFESKSVHPDTMISNVFDFRDIKEAFELVKTGNYKKILLDFSAK